jgi:hypothetical protein
MKNTPRTLGVNSYNLSQMIVKVLIKYQAITKANIGYQAFLVQNFITIIE